MTGHKTEPKKPSEAEIDRQMKESFPASDPPSFSGGDHFIGAPKNRESKSPGGESPEVKKAEKALHQRHAK